MSKSTIRQIAYKWSRPCQISTEEFADHNPDECPGAKSVHSASKCPYSKSPKEWRSGFVTGKRNEGKSLDEIGYWIGATREVIIMHYDLPDPDEIVDRYGREMWESNVDI